MKLFICFAIFIILYEVQTVMADDYLDREWAKFKKKYRKTYSKPIEEGYRKNIFAKRLRKIWKHNKKHGLHKVSWTMGINRFADRTKEEIGRLRGFRRNHV